MIASSRISACFFLDASSTTTTIKEDFTTTLVPGFLELDTPITPEFVPDQVPSRVTTSLKPTNDLIDFTLQPESTTTVDILLHDLELSDDEVSLHEHEFEDYESTSEPGAMNIMHCILFQFICVCMY